MFLLFLFSLLLSLTTTIPLAMSPLILGIWILLISSLFASLICMSISSWMSMIIILIYIGGLNVLFAYFIATMPNQYLFSKPLLVSNTIIFTSAYLNLKLSPLTPAFLSQSNLLITKLLMNFDSIIFLLLALVLFLALVAVVKIASRHNGPLRPFTLN
uniref:NADH dehydrogenase subunit 6 n=1 Tax=Phascolosoma pacificum TaxID=1634976 RepID=A0A1D8BES9_9ANNE|nr:NADH dehydrogenase subunit 6 [Phascolosoma pacificum]AOS53040.1 NADH dehydrogenase subunit 6 [Phascolosoma pacificum]